MKFLTAFLLFHRVLCFVQGVSFVRLIVIYGLGRSQMGVCFHDLPMELVWISRCVARICGGLHQGRFFFMGIGGGESFRVASYVLLQRVRRVVYFCRLFTGGARGLHSYCVTVRLVAYLTVCYHLLLKRIRELGHFPLLYGGVSIGAGIVLTTSFCALFLPKSVHTAVYRLFSIFLRLVGFRVYECLEVFSYRSNHSFHVANQELYHILRVRLRIRFRRVWGVERLGYRLRVIYQEDCFLRVFQELARGLLYVRLPNASKAGRRGCGKYCRWLCEWRLLMVSALTFLFYCFVFRTLFSSGDLPRGTLLPSYRVVGGLLYYSSERATVERFPYVHLGGRLLFQRVSSVLFHGRACSLLRYLLVQ